MKTILQDTALLLFISFFFLFSNCSRTILGSGNGKISSPFESVNVAYHDQVIDPVNGGEIQLENGTQIQIPENAFVDNTGKLVSAPVKIKYREFHNGAEILASGIPMKYKGGNFQTAGMFEIEGTTVDRQPVALADGKSITVNMASFVAGDQYKFYYFDESSGEWIERGKNSSRENPRKKAAIEKLGQMKEAPLKPVRQSANSPVFDLDVNLSAYPELQQFNGVVWQFAGTEQDADPEKYPWVFTEKWSSIQLNRADNAERNFTLDLKHDNKEFHTVVAPVLNGKYYRQAMARFEKQMAEYEQAKDVRNNEEARLAKEADLLRTFSVNNFGIYNWDCMYKNQNDVVHVDAEFLLNKNIPGINMDQVTVYLVTGNQRAVIPVSGYNRHDFMFNPEDDNRLVAILPGDKIAIFRNTDFLSLAAQVYPGKKEPYRFILKVIDDQIVTVANLENVLASI